MLNHCCDWKGSLCGKAQFFLRIGEAHASHGGLASGWKNRRKSLLRGKVQLCWRLGECETVCLSFSFL
ncbi:hypothetical protein KAT36_02300 [Candidatus Pacearchaeota archaeon]|nr:hypothetical protein [Candidatus Pacearchaeota archaeon]